MKKETEKIVRRLKILRGQLEGIERMIAENADCTKIMTQMKAIRSGLGNVTKEIIADKYCKRANTKTAQDIKKALELMGRY